MDASTEDRAEQYYDYVDHDKRFYDDDTNDHDESATGVLSDDDDDDNETDSAHSLHSYDFEKSLIHADGNDDASYYSEEESSYLMDDDDSLGFPPGHITRLDEMSELTKSSSINPSNIPSYFFCPLTDTIMRDPVITPDGTTFERRAILRSLILQPFNPVTGTPLSHEDLVDDLLVRTSIDKARKEAWVKYVVEFRDEDAEKVYEEKVIERQKKKRYAEAEEEESAKQQPSPVPSRVKVADDKISVSSPTLNSTYDPCQNHGWLVPLGVHKIICSSPGLIVTADVHRRSKVVKRRILKKSLAGENNSISTQKKKRIKKRIIISPRKQSRSENDEYRRRVKNIKTTTTAVTRDLILPPGSHVEISETRVHGGRVRGKVCWEEEVTVELDADLVEELKRQEEIVEMMTMVRVSKGEKPKKKAFFRRKQDKKAKADSSLAQTVTYSPDLSSNEIPSASPRRKMKARSPSPLTTIKYSGWISLQWAGDVGNHEKDEAIKCQRNRMNVLNEKEVDECNPHLIADEDDGPWSQPLPLGVYRVVTDNVSVSATPEASSNSIGTLNRGDIVEVVQTQVVMMKRKVSEPTIQLSRMLTTDFEGVRTIRARCMLYADSTSKKRFISGWITLSEEGKGNSGQHRVNAFPIPIGAYVVSSKEPLMSYTGSKIKAILLSGSCMEVNATRIEFDESETVKCNCGQESTYPVIAVNALISLGGYATLFNLPVDKSVPCACGREVATLTSFAEPVKLGVYKVVHPNGVFLTEGIGPNTPIISTLKQNARAEVIETRFVDGCVRGKINILFSCDVSEMCDMKTGWISLFEPPSVVWAELISKTKEEQ